MICTALMGGASGPNALLTIAPTTAARILGPAAGPRLLLFLQFNAPQDRTMRNSPIHGAAPLQTSFDTSTHTAQTLSAGGYTAVLTFSMPGDEVDSCGCALSHMLRLPLITVNGVPFLTAPLSVPQVRRGRRRQSTRIMCQPQAWRQAAHGN